MGKLFIALVVIYILQNTLINIIQFTYWKAIDFTRRKDKKLHLYGIWLFCGLYGQGKTVSLTEYLMRMKKKYGDRIYICTNYGFKGEDFPLTDWHQLLKEYDKPIIFGYDEIQNEFSSRDYKNFPTQLVTMLTQNRKGNGKQIVGTAQRFGRVDKIIRELTSHVVECKTYFGRWTTTKRYDVEDYEEYLACTDIRKKRRIPKHRYTFIQTDKMRDAYDSFKMLESAKQKEYMSFYEKNGYDKATV